MNCVPVISAELNWPAFGAFVNTARVEVYVTPDRREAICVLCDGAWNEGTSTINAASALAQHLYRTFLPEHAPGAAVRFLDAQTLNVPSEESPQYAWLTFHDETELTGPGWSFASHAEIDALIGQSDWRQHRAAPGRSVHCAS